jgi:hypothetical protein
VCADSRNEINAEWCRVTERNKHLNREKWRETEEDTNKEPTALCNGDEVLSWRHKPKLPILFGSASGS